MDRLDKPFTDRDDVRRDVELGVGVEGGVGEEVQDRSTDADVGTGEGDRLGVEGEEEGMQELEEG